jgi:hypothetical protein
MLVIATFLLLVAPEQAQAQAQNDGIRRMTNSLANPLNFQQYGQMTGVGPIRGTVRIYNQFGQQGSGGLNGMNSDPFGGGGGYGGQGGMGGGGGGSSQLPGVGATPGDDPPQGVLLHVNYAQMFLPHSPQTNSNFSNPYNRYPGFGAGFPGGYGGYPYGAGGFPGMGINGGQAMLRPFP